MVICRPYVESDLAAWDKFVTDCRTPLFFFSRGYMTYHQDRFEDSSLLFEADGKLVAILPASREGTVLSSHGGLTYGGMLFSRSARSSEIESAINALLDYARTQGIRKVIYKAIPHIFGIGAFQEDLYFLSRAGASIVRRDLSSVICLASPNKLSKGRKWLIARARKEGLQVTTSENWSGFHDLLSSVLSRHDAKPVHNPDELMLLASRYPENIRLKIVEVGGEMLAAMLLFRFDGVDHSQYLAVSETGKVSGALDLLIHETIEMARSEKQKYFSFGISTYEQGLMLNAGLIAQKESFGARGIVLDFYEINL